MSRLRNRSTRKGAGQRAARVARVRRFTVRSSQTMTSLSAKVELGFTALKSLNIYELGKITPEKVGRRWQIGAPPKGESTRRINVG